MITRKQENLKLFPLIGAIVGVRHWNTRQRGITTKRAIEHFEEIVEKGLSNKIELQTRGIKVTHGLTGTTYYL
jgi:pyocin large subunit-like protein